MYSSHYDSDDDDDDALPDASDLDIGNKEATVELQRLYRDGLFSVSHLKRFLEMGANPCWAPEWDGNSGMSAVYTAIQYEDTDGLRLMHAMWPNIDPPLQGIMSVVEFALDDLRWEVAECLMELGLAYKNKKDSFEFHEPQSRGASPQTAYERAQRAQTAALYTRFIAREERCKLACSSLFSAPIRALIGRDLARLLAGMVWQGHRKEGWDTQEARENWQKGQRECKRLRRIRWIK